MISTAEATAQQVNTRAGQAWRRVSHPLNPLEKARGQHTPKTSYLELGGGAASLESRV